MEVGTSELTRKGELAFLADCTRVRMRLRKNVVQVWRLIIRFLTVFVYIAGGNVGESVVVLLGNGFIIILPPPNIP
jgi:hypothetical protein